MYGNASTIQHDVMAFSALEFGNEKMENNENAQDKILYRVETDV